MKHDLAVLSQTFNHIPDPKPCVHPVQASESDIGAPALTMGPFIHHHQVEPLLQIELCNGGKIIQPFAGVSMETDHGPVRTRAREERAVKPQAVV